MDKAGIYIGPLKHLKGKRALIRTATHGCIVAQFDDRALTRSGKPMPKVLDFEPPSDALGFGWHAFPESHFELEKDPTGEGVVTRDLRSRAIDASAELLNHGGPFDERIVVILEELGRLNDNLWHGRSQECIKENADKIKASVDDIFNDRYSEKDST